MGEDRIGGIDPHSTLAPPSLSRGSGPPDGGDVFHAAVVRVATPASWGALSSERCRQENFGKFGNVKKHITVSTFFIGLAGVLFRES